MIVLRDLSMEISGTNMHHVGLNSFSDHSDKEALLYGFNSLFSNDLFDTIDHYERKIFLNVTMPTEFFGDHDIYLDDKFDEIYTICPYSAKWLNDVKGTDKYKFVWYPLDEKYLPVSQDKPFDVCYHGGVHGEKYFKMLKIISAFNYRYMTMTHGINGLTQQCLPFATDIDLTHEDKLLRISQCKISICFNSLPLTDRHIEFMKLQPNWEANRAFQHAESTGTCPQIKSRLNEAAACKTLNLVERDPWNVVEYFYEPEKHFIYFEDLEDLQQKIFEISADWNSYKHIAEGAYNHFVAHYTTKALYDKIKGDSCDTHSYHPL